MNIVLLSGRLTKNPEVRYTQGADAMAIARFSLAVDRDTKKKEADFISCVAFGKAGEFAEKYLKQGTKVLIKGRWQTVNYTNKDGVKIYTNDCIVEKIEFAESKNRDGAPAQTDEQSSQDWEAVSRQDDLPFY